MARGALPTLIVIGTMKCGTTALHRLLGAHPDVAMSHPKELNFFNGPEHPPDGAPDDWWRQGQWHRGVEWYAEQFDPTAPARGESSPAYTSPDFPEAAGRMARVVPHARLLHLVRDPFERAVSQYRHHRRDGSEHRPMAEALLDPAGHYLARSRYAERLAPYLELFARDQLLVVVQERLRTTPETVLPTVFEHVGVAPGPVACGSGRPSRSEPDQPVDGSLRAAFRSEVAADVAALRSLLDDPLPEWGS